MSKLSKSISGSVIAITGASSGIGRALSVLCAKEGAKLAISDMNAEALAETKTLCEAYTKDVTASILDVRDREAFEAWAKSTSEHFGSVNVIVNNAGVNLSAGVEKMSYEDFEWVMDIDFWGVVHGTKSFLPYLKKSEWGHVVNVSSLFGIISMPNQSAYNAAKFAVRGFSESLRMELDIEKSSVSITCIHPGGVKTNIVNSARFGDEVGKVHEIEKRKKQFQHQIARTTPEGAAQDILNGIKKDSRRVLVGTDAKIFDVMQRLLPTAYQKIAVKLTQA